LSVAGNLGGGRAREGFCSLVVDLEAQPNPTLFFEEKKKNKKKKKKKRSKKKTRGF